MSKKNSVLAVVGLGYVGLPLAVEFGKAGYRVIGYDYNTEKIEELKHGVERMNEVEPEELKGSSVRAH
jgi:UDP-N-acetyl-D-glucosamine/UDP-N-acetyl-D-galactosamine dehydrogenase